MFKFNLFPLFLLLIEIMTLPYMKEKSTLHTYQAGATASFKLVDTEYDDQISYHDSLNLIFAKQYGSELWIRLAEQQTNNGENGPHIDIDICNYKGTGTYDPMDPRVRPCGKDPVWDIWWHDGDKVYANQANSSPCQLKLKTDGDWLEGWFECACLSQKNHTECLSVLKGIFRTKLTKGK